MGSLNIPGPLGARAASPEVDEGTMARTATPTPGPAGVDSIAPAASILNDPEIESLDLADVARKAAYELKKQHPSVHFTSGRRSKEGQAGAIASNVVKNRKWIEETYASSALRTKCQDWVNNNPNKKTPAEIAAGLVAVFDSVTDSELGKFSKHLSGEAFDVQPVDKDADAVKRTIRGLSGLGKFLDTEGGLVRWHAQF